MSREENKIQIRESLESINRISDMYERLANNATTDRHVEMVALIGSLIIETLKSKHLNNAILFFSQELASQRNPNRK